jgi:hypothetical protein
MARVGNISPLLHDSGNDVRLEFVKLLAALSPLNNVNIFVIVHIYHLIYRLRDDSQRCAIAICELLQSSLFLLPMRKSKEKAVNTRHVARCVFLMQRNLKAAIKFYTFLPKFASVDEILCVLRFAYFWADKTAKGQTVKLSPIALTESDQLALPALLDRDDLKLQNMAPHQAIWAIIASSMTAIAKSSLASDQRDEVLAKTFPDFDGAAVLSYLPTSLHQYLFQFIAVFRPRRSEVELTLNYLQRSENHAWSEALKCLVESKSLTEFFPHLIETIRRASQENPTAETLVHLRKAIHYVSFVFSNSDVKNCILNDASSSICLDPVSGHRIQVT